VGDVAGVVAGLAARGDDLSAAAVEHANEQRLQQLHAKNSRGRT
jgi:hypothetical protein